MSYNEKDILDKLETVKLPIDPETGEPKYLKELDQLGKRKNKHVYKKPVDNKASKSKKPSRARPVCRYRVRGQTGKE